ncbi:hypothetical protein M885DRAFT_607173 [Pelagophyceae sp. CCMP2097]|nr:hypothetical protein M885DRAFT_607173 [Pelagophyceae sp. CCMP2097]
MDARPPAAPKPCCVCGEAGGKHCTKCKSCHCCSKACQLVDWYDRGHKAGSSREEPAIVEDIFLADGSKAAALISVTPTEKTDATAPSDDAPDWRGTCAICLDLLPVERGRQTFYNCCCKRICLECSDKYKYDTRCPLCRMHKCESAAESLRLLQKNSDKGNAEAQAQLAHLYQNGTMGLKQNFKRAVQLYKLAAAQSHAPALYSLGHCHVVGVGVEINLKAALLWFRRAAEQ